MNAAGNPLPAISLHGGEYSICRLRRIPDADAIDDIFFIARTSDENSLVCRSSCVPDDAEEVSPGWALLQVEGPLDFSMVGVISWISSVLSDADVSLFAVSTYLTDYFLVRAPDVRKAIASLASAGYDVGGPFE